MVPRHPPGSGGTAFAEPRRQILVGQHASDRIDDRRARRLHDEGLALLEEPGDAATVGHHDRRADRGSLSGDEAEALALRRQHEHVGGAVEVERRLFGRR